MFGHSHSSKKLVVVADIESASVAFAALALSNDGPATIVASSRVSLPFEERTEDATIKGLLAGLDEAGTKLRSTLSTGPYKKSHISHIYAVLNAPWIRSKTVEASLVLSKEERITVAMIKDCAQKAIAADTEFDHKRLVESTVVRVELNGYPTGSPEGKVAHKLAAVVLLSECYDVMQRGVQESLARTFPDASRTMRSGTRALVSTIHAVSEKEKDYVALSVMGETSVIIVVRDGLISQHVIVPEGVRSIVKRISEKGMHEEVLSLLRMIERDECSGEACDAIAASMAHAEIELARVYGEILTKIATPIRLPCNLVLVTQDDLRPWLSKFFARIDFTQCTVTTQPFSVFALSQRDLEALIVSDTSTVADIGLSIAGALVNSEEQL
ncbi:MAG TPA: hypothetical protein VMU13_03310 [Candidatus Paceibacterota bacterium]|nr:hypothetical protein [Candidatus Paceibacterota bacterium]